MVEVVEVDGFKTSMPGDGFETLLWTAPPGNDLVAELSALLPDGEVLRHEAAGGCLVEVKARAFLDDGVIARLRGAAGIHAVKRLAPVLPVLAHKDAKVPFTTCTAMLRHAAGRDASLWELAVEYETARGRLAEGEAVARMTEIVRALRRSIALGIAGTHHADRLLGPQSGAFRARLDAGGLLPAGALNRAVLYVSALMEVKSSMGLIVAAPTAGACAALPGAVIACAEETEASEEAMAKALLAAGLIGVFIAANWTFAAEVGGCQAECGAASCMAAAALATLAGGSLLQSAAAASLALQNMLGLICDPVASRVEIPCLGKNAMAAANALACANMALAGYDPVIPLDEVIEAARAVGAQLPRELRCTALGGLSITPTAQALAAGRLGGR